MHVLMCFIKWCLVASCVGQDVVDPPSSTPAVDANQAIAGLPGVDPSDPSVQEALQNVQGTDKKDDKNAEKGSEK